MLNIKSLIFLMITPIMILDGQSYQKIIETNKSWNISEWIGGDQITYWTNTYRIGADTVINYKIYHGLEVMAYDQDEFKGPYWYLREDSSEQKVFQINPRTHEEWLLYDFKLQEKDTFNGRFDGVCLFKLVVDSISEITIDNTSRKKIIFENGNNYREHWIEGIGSNSGLIHSGFYNCLFDGGHELTCVFKNGHLIFQNPSVQSCIVSNTGIHSAPPKFESVLFYQDPLKLYFDNLNTTNSELLIYSFNGVLIERCRLTGETEFYLSSQLYNTGIYFYRYISKHNRFEGKIVIFK